MNFLCPICGNVEIEFAWHISFNSSGLIEKGYDVYLCQICGSGITYPPPTDETLVAFYQSGTYQKSGGRLNRIIDFLLTIISERRMKEIQHYFKQPGTLLDIGSGKGRFLAQANHFEWKSQGIEPSVSQAEFSRERYKVNVFVGELNQAKFSDNSFDVITAWHVLEHVQKPQLMILEIYRVARLGGLFVCEVPNLTSWQAQLGRGNWFHLDVPRHIVHYTVASLEKLLGQNNFHVTYKCTFSFENGLLGMLQTLLNLMGFPPNLLWRWIKRDCTVSKNLLLLYLASAFILVGPALFLEITACLFNKGGVIRIIAKKEINGLAKV